MILEDRPSPTLTWTSRLSLLAVAVIVLPLSLVAIGDDESPATPATSVESPTDLSGSEIRESETSVSEILKSEISAPTEEAPDEEIATEDIDQPSPAGSTGETITVVRAFYPMPEELAMAFQTFIAYQTHKIEILSATADSRVIEQSGDSEGRTLSRSGLGGGFGGGVRRGRPMQSGLTLIANEDVQQHFGDFIHAVTGAASTQSENGKDTERITLVRESYDVARMDVTTHSEDFGSRKMGNILDDLLRVVKATNQVQWLLLKSHGGQLTVTTTSEFQEALGKFIAFLKERAPTDREQEVSDLNDVQRKIKAKILLENARHKLECNDFLGARLLAEQAEALHAKYELFEDRPELVLNDLRLKEQAPDLSAGSIRQGPSSGNGIGGVGGIGGGVFRGDGLFPGASGGNLFERSTGSPQLPSVRHDAMLTPDQQLASLRMQEQMIGAEIAAIERALDAGARRAALSLMIGRKYADNAVTQKLVDMLSTMLELQQQKAELLHQLTPEHPEVIKITKKLESLRQSLGLPQGDTDHPTDLVTLHLESLKLQQQLLREVIDSLQDQQAAESTRERHRDLDVQNDTLFVIRKVMWPLMQEERRLLQKYGPGHPVVIAIRNQIELERKLHAGFLTSPGSEDKPFESLREEVEQLQIMLERLEGAGIWNETEPHRELDQSGDTSNDEASPSPVLDNFEPRDEQSSTPPTPKEKLDRKIRELEASIKGGGPSLLK